MADIADVGDVGQQTISSAGLDPFSSEIRRIEGRRQAMLDQSKALDTQKTKAYGDIDTAAAAKTAALAGPRTQAVALTERPNAARPQYEESPAFQRPSMSAEDVQSSFGTMMAASLLLGVAARRPFYGAMNALSGAMQGWMNKDEQMFKDAVTEFTTNVGAIKERNAAKRQAYTDAVTEDANDLAKMKSRLELIAQTYDDQVALMTLRTKSLAEGQKVLEGNIEKENQAVERLLRDQANMKRDEARLEEAKTRRAELDSQREFNRQLALDREARLRGGATDRADRGRFKDEQSLRKEYLREAGPAQADAKKVDRILLYADQGGAFADNQLRQAITEFQRGARGTNAMIASMTNFGTLDERIAGSLNRFFAGEYTPEQRGDIVSLFSTLRDQVLNPGLDEVKARYRYLATQNRLQPDRVVVDEGAFNPGDTDAKTKTPKVPGSGLEVTVTPRG